MMKNVHHDFPKFGGNVFKCLVLFQTQKYLVYFNRLKEKQLIFQLEKLELANV